MELPIADQQQIVECRLDLDGLRQQRERYRRLAAELVDLVRDSQELRATFTAEVDEELLERTLAIERECCEFFRLDFDPSARRLTARVDDPDLDPALDALRHALTS